jgi:uncharacterized protein YidB (DUF937 family)
MLLCTKTGFAQPVVGVRGKVHYVLSERRRSAPSQNSHTDRGNTMGILDSLAGALNSSSPGAPAGTTAAPSSAIVSEVLAMLQQHGGAATGLGGLKQAFEGGGLGHLFQSWVGNGQNLPVSASQIQSALGSSGILETIAQRTGMQPGDVAQHLSTLLPQIVDHLTPNGQVHPGDAGSALEGLAQRLFHS